MRATVTATMMAFALLGGSVPAQAGEPVAQDFAAPAERVWRAALAALESQGWRVDDLQPPIGLIVTQTERVQPQGITNWLEASELRYRLSSLSMDLLGRYGALREESGSLAPLRGSYEQTYRGSPVLRFGGGTNEVQRNIIAQRGLGLPR